MNSKNVSNVTESEEMMSRSRNPEAYAKDLTQVCLFSGLGEEEITKRLSRDGISVQHYENNELIYSADGYEKGIGILLIGSAVVTKRGGDSTMVMSVLKPGELFGAAALFAAQGPYVAYIRAQKSTWVILLQEKVFRDMMREDFRIAENYMTYLTDRIRFLSSRIDGFVKPTVEDRLLSFLKEHAKDGVYTPELGYSGLAEAICVSRTTLYRALDTLSQNGEIRRDGKMIELRKEE